LIPRCISALRSGPGWKVFPCLSLSVVAKDYLRKEASPKDYLAIVGLGQTGKADIAEKHDDYLAQVLSDKNFR